MQPTTSRYWRYLAIAWICLWTCAAPEAFAATGVLLWEIGKPDTNNQEFALAPNHYREFKTDGFFLIGQSDSRRDWPYVHPGPGDGWAGGRPHTFTVLFGLKTKPAPGLCRLKLALADTHSQGPPKLRVEVNGHASERELPPGGGDASVNGDLTQAREHQLEIAFPADQLQVGDNELRLTTLSGSWMLYDWVGLETPDGAESAPVSTRTLLDPIEPSRALAKRGDKLMQTLRVGLRHFGEDASATIRVPGAEPVQLRLQAGTQAVEIPTEETGAERTLSVSVEVSGKTLAQREVVLKPVRKMVVYVLPHSHTDIGYTEIQTAIEVKQMENLRKGIEYARRTADYPAGAQFKWNVEVLWAADLYLRRMSPQQQAEFLDAVKRGWVGLNGMYLNELTGLCRPEELVRLFRFATQLAEKCGVAVDSVMISDVPGYTWGTVTAMAHAGLKYFSTAPNYFDRIGDILVQWENKPFYWVSPSSREKVLVWIPYKGYAMSHVYHRLSPEFVAEYQAQLDRTGYPYDIAYMRWSGHGDNAEPDPVISEFIKEWNTKYAYPRFIISSTSEAFRAFEQRYGNQLPQVRGDWTPYWEDGAGSSALETALNRASSDRLTQAEALNAMLKPAAYAVTAFDEAWRNVLLYSEHTWGADVSVSDPECQKTKEQWEIKRSYARQADTRSRELLGSVFAKADAGAVAVDVFNTTSWRRTELVTLRRELATAGDRVADSKGRPVPSQRLSTGELVFVARDVPPFAARRYALSAGAPHVEGQVSVQGAVLDNGRLHVRVDEATGGIAELRAAGTEGNLADTSSGSALNEYLFLPGNDLANLRRNGPVKLTVVEQGPLLGALLIESEAPGCNRLLRELRLVAGFDHLEIINTVDKKRAEIPAKPGDWAFAQKGGKESVNFAFPFNVPEGVVRLDVPLGVMRPEVDQIPSACKNWFTVGRWADVSNAKNGVTWVTLDAPLVEVGDLTATLVGSQTNPAIWRKHVEPTQRLYSWAMNNHWGTNYRAYQDGPVVLRYVLRPHGRFSPAEATRFSTGLSQPLIPVPAAGAPPLADSRLRVEPDDVLVTALKPSDDGKAWIVRLFGASGQTRKVAVKWAPPAPASLWLSDTSEKPRTQVRGKIEVPGYGLVTLRAERLGM